MESKITRALGIKLAPIAVVRTDEKPEKALQFKKGRWGCVMFMFANAVKGKTAVFDTETCGCWGGGVGLGFGNKYMEFPGGVDCFSYFLSCGNRQWAKGRLVGEGLQAAAGRSFADNFLEGERYIKSPELVRQFIDELPITQNAARYVLFKPLAEITEGKEAPAVVVLLANPDQLSALVILANYARQGIENVIIPYAAGCQTIGILPFREAKTPNPRAVVGLTDISARKYVRKHIGADYLTFAMPWELFREMEHNVTGSFLERDPWQSLLND